MGDDAVQRRTGGEVARPDLVAPGLAYSTVPAWDVGEEVKNGTSMAAPEISGMVTLAQQLALRELGQKEKADAIFKDMVALKGKPDIGDQINKKIIAPLANANKLSDFPDFNDAAKLGSGKDMVDRLTSLIAILYLRGLGYDAAHTGADHVLTNRHLLHGELAVGV